MGRKLRKVLLGVGGTVGVVLLVAAGYVGVQVSRYENSMAVVHTRPAPSVVRSTDAAVLARGKHLSEAVASCNAKDCHGADYGGGAPVVMGPVGTFIGSNITAQGLLGSYSDGELARLIRYGIKRDGRSVRFMPVQDFNWMSDAELSALVSYLRTVPPVSRATDDSKVGTLGKVLDRQGAFAIDVARRVGPGEVAMAPPPSASAEYGKYLAMLCTGCHGETLSGGRLPGAPKSMPIPSNLTPDASGLAGWTFEDFVRLLREGMRKNGQKLNPFMPIENFGKMSELEMRALYLYLMSLPPRPFGGR